MQELKRSIDAKALFKKLGKARGLEFRAKKSRKDKTWTVVAFEKLCTSKGIVVEYDLLDLLSNKFDRPIVAKDKEEALKKTLDLMLKKASWTDVTLDYGIYIENGIRHSKTPFICKNPIVLCPKGVSSKEELAIWLDLQGV